MHKFILIMPIVLSVTVLSACNSGGSTSSSGTSSGYSTAAWFCPYSQSAVNNWGMLGVSSMVCNSSERTLTGNGIPSDQDIGTFPNSHCPNTITEQDVSFTATLTPSTSQVRPVAPLVGYLDNGIALEPGTAETVENDGKVWNIEAINPLSESATSSLNLGLDENNAHVQPTGRYHYHGFPTGYYQQLSGTTGTPTHPILGGWAVDGFPVYLLYGYSDPNNMSSSIVEMQSSYQVKSTPEAGRPSTTEYPMGTFKQDYEYVAGLGNLDECNGAFVKTTEFPNGIYAYFITLTYPYIQRCIKGTY